MFKKILFIFLFTISVFLNPVFSYYNPGIPEGYVNDYANTFTSSQETKLETVLEEFQRKTGSEIAVVIVKSFQGDTKENFATKLFEEWQIGDSKDKGVLILISRLDREVRVEVGYGLEGDLPDAFISKDVLNKDVIGFFSQDAYYSGVSNAVSKIFNRLNFKPTTDYIENSTAPASAVPGEVNQIYVYIAIGFFVLIMYVLGKLGIIKPRRENELYPEEKENTFKFGGGRSGGGGSGSKF